MSSRVGSVALLVAALVASVVPAASPAAGDASAPPPGSEPPPELSAVGVPERGEHDYLLELDDPPTAVAFAEAQEAGQSEARAADAAEAHKATIDRAHSELHRALRAELPDAPVLFDVAVTFNGVAVRADARDRERLERMPGVTAVHRLVPKERENASSVRLIGAAPAWETYQVQGKGMRVGIIDTGVDYLHVDFGGPGTAAAYANNNTTVIGDTAGYFPGPKVAGGRDFAGDGYTGSNAPSPDPDPMDCAPSSGGGHGTHVAATAAGYGVRANGARYRGDYNASFPFGPMRIGPGVAPLAKLYALRVFGCTGKTNLVVAALDWAVDPNGDGNPADHLDVVNLSLGTSYGSPFDAESIAVNNAALAGVVVVGSAGNSGDGYYATGSPNSATRGISTAASVDSTDIVDAIRVGAPAAIAGDKPALSSSNYNHAGAADITRSLVYPSGSNGQLSGCEAFSPANASLVNDKFVLLDWLPSGVTTSPCGSATRVTNAAAAGAKGVVLGYNEPVVDITIAGASSIPSYITGSTVAAQLKANLAANPSLTFSSTLLVSTRVVETTRTNTLSTFSSRGPRPVDNALKPDISAPGQTIFSARAHSGNAGRSQNGTSMAAPHMAGVMALLRQRRPGWTVEELKAAAMNTATVEISAQPSGQKPLYGPARVGAGRVHVPNALATDVVAYNLNQRGAVSVSFGAVETIVPLTLTRTVRIANKGAVARSFSVSYLPRTLVKGATVGFPLGSTANVGAGATVDIPVELRITNPRLMQNTHDPTIEETQNSSTRHWLNEVSGLISLVPTAGPTLRVPVHAVVRPASNMAGPSSTTFPGPAGEVDLPLTGRSVETGTGSIGHNSVVTAMELAGTSAAQTGLGLGSRAADLRFIGVTSDAATQTLANTRVYFGIVTHRPWTTPSWEHAEFAIYIDTNRNGSDDYVLWNTRIVDTDLYVTAVRKLSTSVTSVDSWTNGFAAQLPTALDNSTVMVLPVKVANLGLSTGASRFDYRIEARDAEYNLIDTAGPFTFDADAPGIDFTAGLVGGTRSPGTSNVPMYYDRPGNWIDARANRAQYLANKSVGVLLLHHYNLLAKRAQRVKVTIPAS